MNNKEILDKIIKTLEVNHLSLYHSVSKEEIESYVLDLKERIDDCDEIEFDYEILKLFAKFKDAHTNFWTKVEYLDKEIRYYKGKLFVQIDDKFCEILEINGIKAKDVIEKFFEVSTYETEEWKRYQNSIIRNAYYFKMFKILKEDKLDCALKNGEHLIINNVYDKRVYDRPRNYCYKIKDDVLYLKYTKCFNDENMPFADLVKEIAEKVEKFNISQYILDLRDNRGGNSEILNPFQKLVADRKMQGVLLINNGVFSSGRFAVARFKKEFNTTIIGEPTGGAAKSYGYSLPLKVADKGFTVSIRLWDFSDIFGDEGAIQPDILVEQTLQDIEEDNDRVLEVAMNELKKINCKSI